MSARQGPACSRKLNDGADDIPSIAHPVNWIGGTGMQPPIAFPYQYRE